MASLEVEETHSQEGDEGKGYKEIGRKINLWQIMHKYQVGVLSFFFRDMERLKARCREALQDKRALQPEAASLMNYLTVINPSLPAPPPQEFIDSVISFLDDDAKEVCEKLSLINATRTINATVRHLKLKGARIDYSSLDADLRHVDDAIMRDLWDIRFINVSPTLSSYIDNGDLFGESVVKAFPDAVEDIKSAGNCMAVELSTAAVFHLMRDSEYGMRRLAKRLNVRVTHKKTMCPLEYADWDKIITGIKKKIGSFSS